VSIMASIIELGEKGLDDIKKRLPLKSIESVLKDHLKQNRFMNEELMIVHMYVALVGVSQSTNQYAIQRVY
jgi:poly(3-hydroxyalkanoate) synthetase